MPFIFAGGLVYILVDMIAIYVAGGVLLGIFLVVGALCGIYAALSFVAEEPIQQLWGWLVYFIFAPILVGAPFAYVYYVLMDKHMTVSSTSLPVWKDVALVLSFFWLGLDIVLAGGLYLALVMITAALAARKKGGAAE